ncbi:MAG: CBS domain-containing protein [Myxococcota bacterium]
MRVEKLMTAAPRTARPHDSLADAVAVMVERDCGWVPVVDDADHVVGVLTDRDVCLAAYDRGTTLASIAIEGVMHTDVHVCHPTDRLEDALALMQARRVRRVPVVDGDDRLVGLLSLSDIARRAGMNDADRPRGLTSADVAHTLAAICAPRAADDAY